MRQCPCNSLGRYKNVTLVVSKRYRHRPPRGARPESARPPRVGLVRGQTIRPIRGQLYVEGRTATARARYVGISELEPSAHRTFDIVDLRAVEILVAERIDVQLHAA